MKRYCVFPLINMCIGLYDAKLRRLMASLLLLSLCEHRWGQSYWMLTSLVFVPSVTHAIPCNIPTSILNICFSPSGFPFVSFLSLRRLNEINLFSFVFYSFNSIDYSLYLPCKPRAKAEYNSKYLNIIYNGCANNMVHFVNTQNVRWKVFGFQTIELRTDETMFEAYWSGLFTFLYANIG